MKNFEKISKKKFSDDAEGFYAVYQKLFKDLSEDDYTFMGNDEDDYPQFGDAETDPDFVVKTFYGFWQSYSTKRSYVWEEEYDTRDRGFDSDIRHIF